jgi:hypothetical protein
MTLSCHQCHLGLGPQCNPDHLLADIEKVDEPQLKAMFETAAEVMGGLKKAFSGHEKKNESAWRK